MKFSYLLSRDMVLETSKRLIALAVLAMLLPVAVVIAEPIDGTNATKAFNSDIALVASDDVLDNGITVTAVVSAFNAEPGQTDARYWEMASGKDVYEGAIACPRDFKFGTIVEIDGKFYVCEDRMNIRYEYKEYAHIDIFMHSYSEAIAFGRQTKEVTIYPA